MSSTDSFAFCDYITRIFPLELNSFAQRLTDDYKRNDKRLPSECTHHSVPAARVLPFTWTSLDGCDLRFICALYTTTLLHKAVHATKPACASQWVQSFGAHQLPMCEIGFGCFGIVEPNMLLFRGNTTPRKIPLEVWDEVCNYILNDVPDMLSKVKIEPIYFFRELLEDKEFGKNNKNRSSQYEIILEERLAKKWY